MFTTCEKVEKDVNNYYPRVKTVSATLLPDGSVVVLGTIISSGTTSIEVAGFCADTSDAPAMLKMQALATFFTPDSFYVIYDGFERNKKYYFRSWAGNENGYTYGNTVYLENITPTPVTVPCSPTTNTVDFGTGYGAMAFSEIGVPSFTSSTWDLEADCYSGAKLNFSFGSKPVTGRYAITTNPSPNSGEVYVALYTGTYSSKLNSGSYVYINEAQPGILTITICQAPWGATNGNLLTAKFTCSKY